MKKIVYIALALSVGALLFLLPGLRTRNNVRARQASGAVMNEYFGILGQPTSRVSSAEQYKSWRYRNVFPEYQYQDGDIVFFWAKEGFPYYWVLAYVQPPSIDRATEVFIKTGW